MRSLILMAGLLIFGLAVVDTSWYQSPTAASEAEPEPKPYTSLEETGVVTADSLQREVAREVPGFGGWFFDPEDNSNMTIFLREPAAESELAIAAIRRITAGLPTFDGLNILVVQGEYGFLEVQEWVDSVYTAGLLSTPGVEFLDNQEALNRLVVAISDESIRTEVEGRLIDEGVPVQAFEIHLTKPLVPAACVNPPACGLQSEHRPLVGGIQITKQASGGGGSLGVCTLGFIALRQGVTGFVTNSHCTQFPWGLDGTNMHQPSITDLVGTETVDPPVFPGSGGICNSGDVCRYSDSAFIAISGGVTSERGYIANPASNNNYNDWTGVPKYKITNYMGIPGVGTAVRRVGRTSGETSGSVTETCIYGNNVGVRLICQHRSNFTVGGGDSGSPVFMYQNQVPGTNVWLAGILWGSLGTFSDINYVQFTSELGGLNVIAP